jgi:hypothetical protein
MMKVNDELQRTPTSLHDTLAVRLVQLDDLEERAGLSLEGQEEKLFERLAERKVNRTRLREGGLYTLSPKSPFGSISTVGSRVSRYATNEKGKSIDLFGTVVTEPEEMTPNESGLLRTSCFSTKQRRNFDFQTVSLEDC